MVELNATLDELVATSIKTLLQKYKDIFAWNYINFKAISPHIIIKLDTTIPLAHETRYKVNPNYVIIFKQDLDKLSNVGFITPMEEAS
jgi:hypothetical protein